MLQKDTLAAAALPYYGRNLVFINFEIYLIENGLFVKAFGYLFKFYQWRFHIHLYIRNDVTT